MKKYVIELIITEGIDEYWEELNKSGRPGCDDIIDSLQAVLRDSGFLDGFDTSIIMKEYSDK